MPAEGRVLDAEIFGSIRYAVLLIDSAGLICEASSRAEARRNWSEFAESGEGSRIGMISESIGCRRDGTEFPIELAVAAIGEGDQTMFHTFVRDISERKKAEEHQARTAAIVTSSQDGIAALDLDRKVVVWNPALEQMFGITLAQALGRRINEILPPETIEQVDAYIESASRRLAVHDFGAAWTGLRSRRVSHRRIRSHSRHHRAGAGRGDRA